MKFPGNIQKYRNATDRHWTELEIHENKTINSFDIFYLFTMSILMKNPQ
jgi:hypothetical protein